MSKIWANFTYNLSRFSTNSMKVVRFLFILQHGMGMPSISILLHELIKLMYHAGVKDPIFFRLGTCGGLGLEPGTVVVSSETLNGTLEPVHVTVRILWSSYTQIYSLSFWRFSKTKNHIAILFILYTKFFQICDQRRRKGANIEDVILGNEHLKI